MPRGPVVERMDRLRVAGARRVVQQRQVLKAAIGDVPPGATRTTPEERARQYLPAYAQVGRAQGPLAAQYWQQLLQQHGPRQTVQFAKEMARLYENPRYWHLAVSAATPDVAAQGRWLRQQGLGPQAPAPRSMPPRPVKGGG